MRALFLDKEASSKKEKPLDGLFDTATKICVFICEDAEQLLQAPLRRIIQILSRLFEYWSHYLGPAPFRYTIYIRITFRRKDYRLDYRVSPFLAWGDFHARSRFARSTIPEEKLGTTRSLLSLDPRVF